MSITRCPTKYPILATLLILGGLFPAQASDSGISGLLRRALPFGVTGSAKPAIKISGITGPLHDNVRAFLSLIKEPCGAPRWRVERLFEQADKEIGKALRALGHYHPAVKKHLAFDAACWRADFEIHPGTPVTVAALDIRVSGEAESDPAFARLLKKIPLKVGQVLDHGRYEAFKKSLQSLAQERGYFDAKFEKSAIQVDTERNSAVIVLAYASGRRYAFGELTIEQDILQPEFVQRFIPFTEGEPYSSRKLADTYNNLSLGGYFSSLEIKPAIEDALGLKVPIAIALQPQKKHRYEVGIGYDTNYGPLFSLAYTNRRVNRRGHTLNAELAVSPVLSTLESRYNIPLQNPTTDFFSFGAGFKHEEPDTFTSDQFKLSLQRQHISSSGWKLNNSLDYIYEAYRSADVDNSSRLLVPGLRLQYTQSNSQFRETRGYQLNVSLAGAHDSVISDVSFLQAGAGGKWVAGVPWSGRFITRGEFGATLVSDFDKLPASYRYYTGGAQSIRGYEYKELGPKNAKGEVTGGKMLSILSLEYEQFLGEKWGVAAFIDAGDAYHSFGTFDAKVGAGLGIRWISPVGPLRIDFAVPLNESGSSFQIHFAAGAQLL